MELEDTMAMFYLKSQMAKECIEEYDMTVLME
jgi:hypothetical protein